MKRRRWEESGEACPKCQRETEITVIDGEDGNTYDDAERCVHCRWITEFFPFEDREPQVIHF
jgi:hypothetical protein